MSQKTPHLSAEMLEQQELYSWLRGEYAELYIQQEQLKKKEMAKHVTPQAAAAIKQLQIAYQTRFAAYQAKLEKYHKCQKLILASSTAVASSLQKQPVTNQQTNAATGTKTSSTAATGAKKAKSDANAMNNRILASTFETYGGEDQQRQPKETSALETKMRVTAVKAVAIKSCPQDNTGVEVGYIFGYEELRSSLLKRCMELGIQRNKGMAIWNEYWDGLRKFLLYRISKPEFEVLLLHQLNLPNDVICLHNCFIGSIMSNVRSGLTAKANIPLLPYVCTHAEIQQYSTGEAGVKSTRDAASSGQIEMVFFPLVSPDCLDRAGGASQNSAADAEGKDSASDQPGTTALSQGIVQAVNRIHGDVLAVRTPLPDVEPQNAPGGAQAVKAKTKKISATAPSTTIVGATYNGRNARADVHERNEGTSANHSESMSSAGLRRSRDLLMSLDSASGTASKVAKTANGDSADARGVSGTRSGLRLAPTTTNSDAGTVTGTGTGTGTGAGTGAGARGARRR